MPEVIVVATFAARSGQAPAVERALRAAIAPTHAEDGCILYALHAGVSDPDTFVFIERWASDEALAVHAERPWVTGLSAIAGLLATPPQVATYRALPDGEEPKGRL
jgi:quinol monooxygenase YgiN